LVLLVFFDNPFYGFQYVTDGWFFPFLNSLFLVSFYSGVLCFWLLLTDKMRNDDLAIPFSIWQVPKIGVVGIYFILSLIFYTWISIRDSQDPVFGTGITAFTVFFLDYFINLDWNYYLAYCFNI